MHFRTISLLIPLLWASAARAAPLTVVPTGDGDSLIVAAKVAAAVVKRLNQQADDSARLGYVAPASSAPRVDTTEANALLDKAFKSFEMLDFAAVKADAGKALSIFKKAVKAGASGEGYVETLNLLAASAVFDGDNATADKMMNDAVIFDADPPDKKRFNPTVQALYKKVLAEKQTGAIDATSTPESLIFFNRELKGVATGRIELRAGLYLIEIYRPGFLARRRWFRVRPGETRKLDTTLKGAPAGETAMMRALHRLGSASAPDATVTSAMAQLRAKELMIVAAQGQCTMTRCKLSIRRVRGAAFVDKRVVQLGAQLDKTVEELIRDKADGGQEKSPLVAGARACTLSTDCAINEKCIDGRCQRPSSVTRKWWFWTLVGAVAAGAAVAIIVPLSRPDGPVIEVR